MREIDLNRLEELTNNFKQYKKKWVINQETGEERELVGNVLSYVSKLNKPKIFTDDDGILEIVTIQICWDMKNNSKYTGKLLYMLYLRR